MPDRHWIESVRRLPSGAGARRAGHAGHWCRATHRATPAPSWSSAPAIPGGRSAAGTLRPSPSIDARELIASAATRPELRTVALSDKAPYQHGVQCCGGKVTVLLEPLPVVPAVAIFGVGHVGLELARILARHDIELHLIDTRPEQLSQERLSVLLADALAQVHVHQVPLLPEIVLGEIASRHPRADHDSRSCRRTPRCVMRFLRGESSARSG